MPVEVEIHVLIAHRAALRRDGNPELPIPTVVVGIGGMEAVSTDDGSRQLAGQLWLFRIHRFQRSSSKSLRG